jgi:hypothetical protein
MKTTVKILTVLVITIMSLISCQDIFDFEGQIHQKDNDMMVASNGTDYVLYACIDGRMKIQFSTFQEKLYFHSYNRDSAFVTAGNLNMTARRTGINYSSIENHDNVWFIPSQDLFILSRLNENGKTTCQGKTIIDITAVNINRPDDRFWGTSYQEDNGNVTIDVFADGYADYDFISLHTADNTVYSAAQDWIPCVNGDEDPWCEKIDVYTDVELIGNLFSVK